MKENLRLRLRLFCLMWNHQHRRNYFSAKIKNLILCEETKEYTHYGSTHMEESVPTSWLNRFSQCNLLKFWIKFKFKGPTAEHHPLLSKSILLSNEFTAKIPLQIILLPLFLKLVFIWFIRLPENLRSKVKVILFLPQFLPLKYTKQLKHLYMKKWATVWCGLIKILFYFWNYAYGQISNVTKGVQSNVAVYSTPCPPVL